MRRKIVLVVVSAAYLFGCDRTPTALPATVPATTRSLTSAPSEKPMHFEHREFVLDLDPSWSALAGNDPNQFQFESKTLASNLTISVMEAAIPRALMQQTAEKFLELRLQAETATDPTRVVTFGDQWVTLKPDGETVEVAYVGYDNRGRIFRFMGFVTTQKVVNFYCETVSKDNAHAKQIFDESFRGFRFYVP